MIAVIVATKREADAVRGVLPPDARLFQSGVGKVNAAMSATAALWAGAVAVVNAGLAGSISPCADVGAAYAVSEAVQHDCDLSAVDGLPVGTVDGRASPFFPLEDVPGMDGLRIGTADRFRATQGDIGLLRSLGCAMVDMECAAIAQVCERAKTPLFAVKVVSDRNDGDEYAANADKCLARLAEATKKAIKAATEAYEGLREKL